MVAKPHNVSMFENTGNDQMDLHKCTEENAGALLKMGKKISWEVARIQYVMITLEICETEKETIRK